jgi:threonine synthase
VRRCMADLANGGAYRVGDSLRARADSIFWGAWCGEEETLASIAAAWREHRILVDPHTAVALDVYGKYRRATSDGVKTVIASTASPFKFNASVARAVLGEGRIAGKDEFELLDLLSAESGMPAPAALRGLRDRKARHAGTCRAPAMADRVAAILGI